MRSPRVPWWPGSVVSDSGVHVHHLVFGIVTMMIAGAVGFTALGESPYAEICALVFGIGDGPDDRRVRPLGLPRRRLLGRGGPLLDRRHRDRRLGDVPDPDRLQPASPSRPGPLDDTIGSIARRRHRLRHRSRSASSSSGSCTASSASSSSRSRSTAPAGSASRAPPGRGAATASGDPTSRRRPRSASPPTATPSASRTPSATSSAASRARASQRSKTRRSPPAARPPKNCASAAGSVSRPTDEPRRRRLGGEPGASLSLTTTWGGQLDERPRRGASGALRPGSTEWSRGSSCSLSD